MWHDFLVAISLMLVLEGILPFASPTRLREAFQKMLALEDSAIRTVGLLTMLMGVALLYWVN